jgi:hypothetical protein
MNKIIPLFLILFLYAYNIQAQPYGPPITFRGIADCGQWVKARSLGTAGYLETGVIGFINGTSNGSGIDVWYGNGSKMSDDAAFLFVDNYCQKNPLDSIWSAAAALANANTNNRVLNQLRKLFKQ